MKDTLLRAIHLREPEIDATKFGVDSSSCELLEKALSIQFDAKLRTYFSECIPHESDGWGFVDFLNLDDLRGWNLEGESNQFFLKLGFVTFAHNSGPSFFCFDNDRGRVLEIDHSVVGYDSFQIWSGDDMIQLPKERSSSYAICNQMWPSLESFFEDLYGRYAVCHIEDDD